ncbi:L-rhamnose mutarotase [Flavobacterium sp. 1]|uniref:L-rhamnose mutarotase n=1 Tax=Flavobacterium sp. 1 TaxID=2035200 RepID=UPI00269F212F
MNKKRFCFACNLVNESQLIEEYKAHHAQGKAWSEITESIKASGILDMEIYLAADHLFMIIETDESYSHKRKQQMDALNSKVQEWKKNDG